MEAGGTVKKTETKIKMNVNQDLADAKNPKELIAALAGIGACREAKDWVRDNEFGTAQEAWEALDPGYDWAWWLIVNTSNVRVMAARMGYEGGYDDACWYCNHAKFDRSDHHQLECDACVRGYFEGEYLPNITPKMTAMEAIRALFPVCPGTVEAEAAEAGRYVTAATDLTDLVPPGAIIGTLIAVPANSIAAIMRLGTGTEPPPIEVWMVKPDATAEKLEGVEARDALSKFEEFEEMEPRQNPQSTLD